MSIFLQFSLKNHPKKGKKTTALNILIRNDPKKPSSNLGGPLVGPANIQPVVVVRGLKRQQAAALTNFVGCFLLVLSNFFFLSFCLH